MTQLRTSETGTIRRPIWSIRGDDAAVAGYLRDLLTANPRATIAIAGGRTPMPILVTLARSGPSLSRATILPTDERMVSRIGAASNLGMIERRLGERTARLVPLTPDLDPPRFDLVWLGMGEDGKIASLFTPADCEISRRAVKHVTPRPLPWHAPYERLSLNLSALVNTSEAILVVRGERKRHLIEEAIQGQRPLPLTAFLRAASMPVRIFWTP